MQKTELDVYIGKLLNNRYLIRDSIGKGGMGRVYLSEDSAKGGMPVAVKILSLNLVNEQMAQRFAREIFIGSQLGRKSKHIVRVLSYGVTEEKIPFYVMEYLEGITLKELIKQQPLTISKFLNLCHQICLGLQCAHQGVSLKGEIYPIIHRDIKPENIFITENASKEEIVKILDFGIAKFLTERSGMTVTDCFIGSLPYCSPEHMEGCKSLDARSDIYSLGVLMFEMITGKHPFQTKTNSFGSWYQAHHFQKPLRFEDIDSHIKIPQKLKKLIISCLAKEVKDRPQSVSQILECLEDLQENIDSEVTFSEFPIGNQIVKHFGLKPFGNLTSAPSANSKDTKQDTPQEISISEQACLQQKWPQDKPVETICFPYLLNVSQKMIPTFWAMLPKQEIAQFLDQAHSVEFLYQIDLYPIILWITVLCDVKFELTRWLSYFLDLKDMKTKKMVEILANTGYYHVLFFPLEEPTTCSHVITINFTNHQCEELINCLGNSQTMTNSISIDQSKSLLKSQYEKNKPDILNRLVIKQKNKKIGFTTFVSKLIDNFLTLFSHPLKSA
ncbi:serine/threonine protein kinase [Aetokthonos hydrillicola Thurmond2011]|jgi:serine/threonine-protein kinase|uniref:non-specific serine/threonine protein kinase n=1 Tax=Aetokthonos hydrillicola Thurmond2011 TaxID=2712845 RepID=A0AAP5IBB0_9CYAN|nr:serine/threonine-protein kinase [Aetokthonos hydrillicola]MBO3459147.1 serine/threonine protein kinase [Aetokthonos hydrillicola CCALA 1050]MBW4584106.1 serine/threonine protein kinase [Aetokthonos hydrillicola CCALA 1050]MDR9898361.1 serine/threonine protein kinase [Aetokthonos hydrillicola Thurmond2011]